MHGLLGIVSTLNNLTVLIVSDIFKTTSYSFALTAYNDIGPSPNSTVVCFTYTIEDYEFSHELLFLVPN